VWALLVEVTAAVHSPAEFAIGWRLDVVDVMPVRGLKGGSS